MSCPYCQSGRIAVEPGTSLAYRCTDCDGVARGKGRNRVAREPGDPVFSTRDCDDPGPLEPNDSETKDT